MIHRPSGTVLRRSLGSVALDLRRQQFLEPAHRRSSCLSDASAIERGADLGDEAPRPRGASSARAGFDLLDDAAADHHRVGDLRPRAAPSAASRMPKPTPTGSFTCGWMRGNRRCDVGDVDVAGAGHALERHVIEIAARRLRRPARCARRSRWARAGRSDRCRRASSSAAKSLALLGRIVDDEHAVDAGRLRSGGEALACPCARSGWRSPSARPASCRIASCGTRATIAEHVRQADAVLQRALAGALDHRAVGHRVGERHAELDDVGAGLRPARASAAR